MLSVQGRLCAPCACGQSCPALRNPMDCRLPGSSVYGVFKQEYWFSSPSSRGSFRPQNQTHVLHVSCVGRQILYHWVTGKAPLRPEIWPKMHSAMKAACEERGMSWNATEYGSQGRSRFRGQIVWVCLVPSPEQAWKYNFRVSQAIHEGFKFCASSVNLCFHRFTIYRATSCNHH